MQKFPNGKRPASLPTPHMHSDSHPLPTAAVLVQDATIRRLILSATHHLGLTPAIVEPPNDALDPQNLELIIADEAIARGLIARRSEHPDLAGPALIVVRDRALTPTEPSPEPEFDGILYLPQDLGPLTAQLGIFLYTHRAFARRFHTAMEELQLNRRIFASVTSGISVANATLPDLPLVYVNPAFEVMTGYGLEEVQGKNCRFLQGADRDQPGVTLIREALLAERQCVAVLKNYRKDGSSFWNELFLSPIRNRFGELTHIVGIQMDVTARVEFEAALRESEKLAAVGRLAASIAHEINNPLESVMNLLYLAQQTSDPAESREYLTDADKELQRVALITSQSLRFYRQSTRPSAVLCSDLIHSVVDIYGGKLVNASVRVEKRERMSESIVCLESEIRQVLSNLIRNSIDAMQRSGGRLLIRTGESTDWQTGIRGARITVADTGTGISPDTMKHLYTAFFSTKGIAGTGLGLWVSAEIVKRHRGHLRVRSRQRPDCSWTVFELFLPYQGPTN